MEGTIYTIGHSTRSIEEFLAILEAYGITLVVDIRTIPKSRHNPQFADENLRKSLQDHNKEYMRMEGLGGLRKTKKDSINDAWKNLSFRGYADYMQTEDFSKSVEELISKAKEKQLVIMCAEAVPWRCHRSLVGDALTVRNIKVVDIISATSSKLHKLTSFACVQGTTLTYPKENVVV